MNRADQKRKHSIEREPMSKKNDFFYTGAMRVAFNAIGGEGERGVEFDPVLYK